MKKTAIACQGGGSHTAFTAGVLSSLLEDDHFWKDRRVIALSGTSGGALCAALAWSRLLQSPGARIDHARLKDKGKAAAQALYDFWMDMACGGDNPLTMPLLIHRGPFDYLDTAANTAWQIHAHWNPLFERDCKLISRLTRRRMQDFFSRHFPQTLLDGKDLNRPRLHIGATNICEGWSGPINVADKFGKDSSATKFHNILLASAAIPPLFQPARVNGDWYWDGLYSHNPPVECLANPTDDEARHRPPPESVTDEIWVIQINPERTHHVPSSATELVDRRNELIGNLTLASEMYHIDAMNYVIERHHLAEYQQITLRLHDGLWGGPGFCL